MGMKLRIVGPDPDFALATGTRIWAVKYSDAKMPIAIFLIKEYATHYRDKLVSGASVTVMEFEVM